MTTLSWFMSAIFNPEAGVRYVNSIKDNVCVVAQEHHHCLSISVSPILINENRSVEVSLVVFHVINKCFICFAGTISIGIDLNILKNEISYQLQ